jgi:IMP dehydrogenase
VRDVELTRLHGFSGFPVVGGKVVGIVTGRDLRFETRYDAGARDHDAAREADHGQGRRVAAEAKALMHKHKLERVLVVNDAFELRA